MKDIKTLAFLVNPDKVYLGAGTTAQDLIDWINHLHMENQLLQMENQHMKMQLAPIPDNKIDISNFLKEVKP